MGRVKNAVKGTASYKEYYSLKERDSAGNLVAFNLNGYTVTLTLYTLNRLTTLVADIAVTLEDELNGLVSWTVTTAMVAATGRWLGRFKFVRGADTFWGKDEFTWQVKDNR